MARYENIIITSPDQSQEEADELMKRITANMEKAGAAIVKMDDWAVRRLAFPIKKKDRGHYFFFLLDMEEKNVAPLGKFYRTIDPILRHMFVRVEDAAEGPKKPPEIVVFDEFEGEFA